MHMSEPAAVAAGIASLGVVIINSKRGKSVKILQVAMLVFFIILSIFAIFLDLERHWLWVRIGSSLFFAIAALISILIKKPLTLQYAREQVPKEKWNTPEFIQTNYAVSWTWFFVFIAYLIIPALRLCGFNISKVFGAVFAVTIALAALKFSLWYPRRMHLVK